MLIILLYKIMVNTGFIVNDLKKNQDFWAKNKTFSKTFTRKRYHFQDLNVKNNTIFKD